MHYATNLAKNSQLLIPVFLTISSSHFTAIQSLDSLNDQIVEYIFRPKNGENTVEQDLLPKHQDTLKSSMVLIRRLLHDAQSKFRKMVEDNKKLAARIDGSINAANQEVNTLRAELLDTNKKLTEISESSNQQECGTQCDDECKYTSYLPYVMMNVII